VRGLCRHEPKCPKPLFCGRHSSRALFAKEIYTIRALFAKGPYCEKALPTRAKVPKATLWRETYKKSEIYTYKKSEIYAEMFCGLCRALLRETEEPHFFRKRALNIAQNRDTLMAFLKGGDSGEDRRRRALLRGNRALLRTYRALLRTYRALLKTYTTLSPGCIAFFGLLCCGKIGLFCGHSWLFCGTCRALSLGHTRLFWLKA